MADPVSRELPALYDAEIKPLLMDAAPLLKLAPDRQAADRGGEVVLREHIVMVDENGNRTEADHNVYRAVAESGVSAVSRDSEGFNKKRTRLHLALARTIQPDGKSLPVREDAAFMQTPQRSADYDIYNDQGEMVLIYPDVKQGSATESIVVGEMTGRIPGEFTFQRGFGAGWPVRRDRFVLEAPRALADRMRMTILGSGVPEPKREELQGGARIRWTWERQDIPGVRQEEQRVGMDQTGPMLFITTLPDWESFIQWYLPQAEKNMELSDSLKGRIDEWTKEARSPEEITAILLRKVASEVRYVGLEFGNGDLVPRPVDAVWDNQYGDCKDKACLLTAMLRHKGINACPALINTAFPGRVERRSPDFRHFDHCITAVAGADGKWIFCDPTIPGLAPGGIGPADGGREVLLVKAGAEWARTPAHDFGTVRHRIEAVMDAAGGLSGWATLGAEGYNAARFLEMERKSTPESLRASLQSSLSRLATGITAVDVRRHPVSEGEPYKVEAYILIPGSGGASVPLLADAGYVPQTGNETQRDTAFPSWREVYEIEARITLPPGLAPASLPEPLKSVSNWAEASGGWEWRDGALLSRFRFHSREDNIAPTDFPAFAAQMRTVNAWISRPLPLKTGGDGTPAPAAAAADSMDSLPHLTSVDGQMMLVESKYPEGANAALRRAALERSIRYFPGNQEMLYRAGCQLAWLDIREGDPAAAIRRLDSFQESCRPHVDAEEAALGDHFRGLALNRLERRDEALAVFAKLSEDKALSTFRRTLALYWSGILLEKKEPEQALDRLREGIALQETEVENILYPPWARLLLKAGKADELKAGLKKLVEEREDAAPAVLTRMAGMADSIPDGDRPEYLKILTDLGPASSFGQEFVTAMKAAEGTVSLQTAGNAIRTRLEAFLKQHPDSSSDAALREDLKTVARITETLSGMIEAGIKEQDQESAVRMALEAALKSGPDDDLPAIVLNLIRAVSARDFEKKESALLDEVLALGEMLPKSEDNHYEAVYARLLVLQQRGQREELRRVAEAMTAEADEGRSWIAGAPLKLLLKDAVGAGDRPEVLRLCQVIRGYPDYRQWADSYFYEAMVLILDGQYDGALLALDALADTPAKSQAAMPMRLQAESLLKWARRDRAAAVKWWKDSAAWWPAAVVKAAEKLNPDAQKAGPPPLPVIPDQDPRGGTAATAAGKKDFGPMAEFLLLLGGAGRLDPLWMQEYGRLMSVYAGPGLLLEPAEKELNESLASIAGFVPEGVDHLLLLLFVEEAFFRADNWERTAATAVRYFSQAKELNVQSGFALRYWAVAVDNLKSGRGPLLEAFQKIFESHADEKERPRNLWLYGIILTQDGRPEEAATLIQKELDGGQLDDSHPMMPQLRQLLEQSRKTPSGNPDDPAALATMADRWMKIVKPAWLDWVEPAGNEGPELMAKAVGVLRNPEQYPDTSILKSVVMVLRDPSQPADIREEAVNRFLINAPMGSSDPARRSVEWNLVFTAPAMPEPMRARSLAVWVLECASQGWTGTFRRWSVHPLLAGATEGQQFLIRQWRGVLAEGSIDRTKLKAAALALVEKDLEEGMIWSFRQLFMCLANQDPAAAAEVLGVLREKSFPKPVEEMAGRMTADMRRYLEDVRELEPVHAALTGVVLKALSAETALPLSDADLLAGETRDDSVNAPTAVRLALLLRNIASRNFDHSNLNVWRQLLWCLDPARSGTVREAMARVVIESATSDETASGAVELANDCLDMDDPEQARILEELLKPLAGRDEWTSTADWLAFTAAIKSLRTGAATDVTPVIAGIRDSDLKSRLSRRQIHVFLATGRKAELKKFLRRMPSSALLDFSSLSASVAAWQALGQPEEAEAGRKRLRGNLGRGMGIGWSMRNIRGIITILEAAVDMGDPSLVPPGLEEDLGRWMADPKELAAARFMIACLREDWASCASLAGEVIQHRPSVYPRYFIAGKACAKMGLKDQAVPLLRTYLEKTHDEPSVPEARALLKSLEP